MSSWTCRKRSETWNLEFHCLFSILWNGRRCQSLGLNSVDNAYSPTFSKLPNSPESLLVFFLWIGRPSVLQAEVVLRTEWGHVCGSTKHGSWHTVGAQEMWTSVTLVTSTPCSFMEPGLWWLVYGALGSLEDGIFPKWALRLWSPPYWGLLCHLLPSSHGCRLHSNRTLSVRW